MKASHTRLEDAALNNTVDVDWQQFHALRQNELPGGRRRGTVLAITCQQLSRLCREVLTNLATV